uniref:SCAN box domain-containing protein n=1 Tax=Oryzias latipes TaxID=8090 RepID=A0A3P9HC65_ORYLA
CSPAVSDAEDEDFDGLEMLIDESSHRGCKPVTSVPCQRSHLCREPVVHPKEFYNRLKDLYKKWIQPSKRNKEKTGEIFILKQFYHCLSLEFRVWVQERKTTSAKETAFPVKTFLAAQRGPKSF